MGVNILTISKTWDDKEVGRLKDLLTKRTPLKTMAKIMGRSEQSTRNKIWHINNIARMIIPQSTMPIYDKPLRSEGDALILSDIEAPYHHADFLNRVLDLADTWGIKTLHLAGDLLHFDSLSAWGAEWVEDTDEKTSAMIEFMQTLPAKYKEKGIAELEKLGAFGNGNGLSDELTEARRVFRSLTNFNEILVAIGNHDDRYLRALDKAIASRELLVQMERIADERWKIAPYYYTMLDTERGAFRITHPRGAGRTTAQDLCAQFHCHVIMGHSHRWAVNKDVSGDFWAIQTGHCVDENRLAYVMQRDAKRDAHCLGATIIRGGVPWVLGEWSQWEILKKC
jgi:hypothetical protein